MSDDTAIKIMQSLGLDYNPAINSTLQFQKTVGGLNTQLEDMKNLAVKSAKDVNEAFSSQLGGITGNKTAIDQFSNQFKTVKQEAQATATTVGKMAKEIKESNLVNMQAQAAYVQQRTAAKGLSSEYSTQASTLRDQLSVIQARLQAEGKLSAEETEQTAQLKEQLDILRAQTRAASHDENRLNPSVPKVEIENRASWFSDATKFYAITKAAKEATSTIKDVEMGMIEISRVMTDTSFVFDDYRDKLFKLGVDYGQTFDNIQAIALRWAQSGYNVTDSLKLTETSLLALNTAELDATQATESMIGIMAQWQLQAEDLALVIDKVNLTADTYAITSQDLVDGLLRSSGAAKNMNMTLDETIGLLTVMREASGRTGKEVGNALNSILSYVTRSKSVDDLESLGIQMFTDETQSQFRNALDIFKDISTSWGSLSTEIQDGFVKSADEAGLFSEEMANAVGIQEQWNDVQKRDASQSAAGTHRRNYFIGMIERMSNVQGVLNGMMDAGGYSMSENAAAMETLEKKQESLKTSAEALAVAIGDAGLEGALKLLADGGTKALNMFNDMPDGMKDFVLATTTTFTAVKALEFGMKTFGVELPSISQMISSLTSGTWSLTTALKAGKDGLLAFATANAPLLALAGAVGVIVALTNAEKKRKEEMEQSLEVFRQQKEISNSIDELIPKYEQLASKSKLNAEEQQKLLDVKRQITDLLPETKDALDNENLSLSTQLEIIKELNEEELERAKHEARKNIAKYENQYDDAKIQVEEATKALEKWTAVYDELYQKRDNLTGQEYNQFDISQRMITAQTERLEHYKNIVNIVEQSINLYNDALENQNNTLDESTEKTEDIVESNESYKQSLEELTETFNDATDRLSGYHRLLDEVNSKEGLSAQSKRDIISNYQELLPYLSDEQELRRQLIEIISEEEETQRIAYANMILSSEEFYNAKNKGYSELLDALNEYYDIELENFKSLADAKGQVEAELVSKLSGIWAQYYGAISRGNDSTALMLEDMVMKKRPGWEDANEVLSTLHQIGDIESSIKNIALDLNGIDFKEINSSGSKKTKSPSAAKKTKEENKALQEALKLLEHRKRISEETQDSIRNELAELQRINSLYVKTDQERMDMAERIYATEKRLRDRTLQDSLNFITEKKNFNQMSVEDEIAALTRVRENQINNIDAVKHANLELYKLKKQQAQDAYNREESTIQHLAKLSVLSVEQQIERYRKLYEVKVTSLAEEQKRTENLFNLYKSLISNQQKAIKDAHDDRIKRIDDERKAAIERVESESKARKDAQDEVIKGIEKELALLNKQEEEYDHDKKMADLREQLAYWEVRTSEDARKKVVELKKQIDEAEHKREVELQRQALEEKKKTAQDEISNIEDSSREEIQIIEETAKRDKEIAEQSYKDIEIAFDSHKIDMIALAATMSEGMFDKFKENYLDKIQDALTSGDYGSIGGILGDMDGFFDDVSGSFNDYDGSSGSWRDPIGGSGNQSNPNNAQIYNLASTIAELKKQYALGNNPDAPKFTKPLYEELSKLSPDVSDYLSNNDYIKAADYVKGLPKMHKGGKSLSYGAVEMMPGELTFPPDLSVGLERLFPLLSNLAKSNVRTESRSFTDSRKQIKIDSLLRIDKNYMEDDVDERSLARELQRQLTNLV